MTVPMIILAVGSVAPAVPARSAAGWQNWLDPVGRRRTSDPEPPISPTVLTFAHPGSSSPVGVARSPGSLSASGRCRCAPPMRQPGHRRRPPDLYGNAFNETAVHAARHLARPGPGVRSTTAASTARSTGLAAAFGGRPAGGAGCRPASSARTPCRCSPAARRSSWRPAGSEVRLMIVVRFPWLTVLIALPARRRGRCWLAAAARPATTRPSGRAGVPRSPTLVSSSHVDRLLGVRTAGERAVPVRRDARRLDPGVRGHLRRRRRRHRARADRADRRCSCRSCSLRRPGTTRSRRGRTQAAGRSSRCCSLLEAIDHRGLRGHRRLPLLRAVRGHADPDVLPDRRVRRPAPRLRGGEVPPLLACSAGCSCSPRSSGSTSSPRPAGRRHVRLHRADRRPHDRPAARRSWLFLGFFIAFAIKAPLVPVPHLAARRRRRGAGRRRPLLVGVLDKVGTFGFLRFCLPLFPDASPAASRRLVIVLAVIGILYGALLAIGQKDMKRLVAYTSVSHFGFIALGHLRVHHPGPVAARPSTWSTTGSPPARCSSWSASHRPRAGRG